VLITLAEGFKSRELYLFLRFAGCKPLSQEARSEAQGPGLLGSLPCLFGVALQDGDSLTLFRGMSPLARPYLTMMSQ
jgi:hypothetical protein